MMNLKRDALFRDGNTEQRRLVLAWERFAAFRWTPSADGKGRKFSFEDSYAPLAFHELMTRCGDFGYRLAAELFRMTQDELPRVVRSHLLTELALGTYVSGGFTLPVRESQVSGFGAFIELVIVEHGAPLVEWFEDMNQDDPMQDLRPQPTALVRGVLTSMRIDHRRASEFWRLAAASELFPERIFHDPCPESDGATFSPYQRRFFGRLFELMPEEAVRRFAAVLRDRARTKELLVERPDRKYGIPKWVPEIVPISDAEHDALLADIVANINDNARRLFVGTVFSGT